MKLRGKIAVITGSGQGIGKATAIEFMREHAKIVLLDIDEKNSKEVEDHIIKQGGVAKFMKCDVTKKEQVKRCMDNVIKQFGRIDILVNCAGVLVQKPIVDMTERDWDEVINTNLKGTFTCTKMVAKHMIDNRRGKIIMVSSIAGKAGLINTSAFSSANGGLINLTKELTQELSPYNININVVSPGLVNTEFINDMISEPSSKKEMLKNIPLNIFGTPEDVANAALFLASKDSDFITGHNLVVDGGWKTH
ncbi:MAG: SDR family NAD(P)-dependent oxidoreductase [Nanobdellota archaeon]